MNHFVTAQPRSVEHEIDQQPVNLAQHRSVGELGTARAGYQAFFDGDSRIWGVGPDLDAAIGSCLRTAGFKLPDRFLGQTDTLVGSAVRLGTVEGVSYQGLTPDKKS